MNPSSLLAPFEQRDLQVAAAAGAVVAGVALAARRLLSQRLLPRRLLPQRLLPQRRVRSPAPGSPRRPLTPLRALPAGAFLVAVAAAVLVKTGNAPGALLLALGVLALGGAGAAALQHRWRGAGDALAERPASWIVALASAALVVPGSVLLSFGPAAVPGPAWVHIVVLLATPVAAGALWSFDRRWGRLALPLLVIAAAGIYATTPDTQQILILLGATLGVSAIGWWPALRLGPVAVPAVVGLITWTVAVDGRGRHSSIVGGLACLGLLMVEPLATALVGPEYPRVLARLRGRWALPAAVVAQAVVVGVSSRLAGLRPTTVDSVAIVLPLLVVTTAVLVAA